jgi:cellulose synthase operon protein C
VAAGGLGPALAALRALKASEPECVELVRFSASERYLPLRALAP